MTNSIHLVRWLQQFEGLGWDIHLFPVEDVAPHPSLRNVTLHDLKTNSSFNANSAAGVRSRDEFWPMLGTNWPLPSWTARCKRLARRWFPWQDRAWRLAETIKRLQPDIIHSHEFQHAAYLTLDARERLNGRLPPWIVSNWGHDVYLFGRLSAHRAKVQAVLKTCDYYTAECARDVKLAQNLGLTGEVLGIVPNTGGFDIEGVRRLRQSGQTSARRTIALKGYQNYYGRAIFGLRGVALAADALKNYRIVVYSASEDVKIAAELLGVDTGLGIELLPQCTNEDMLRLHGMCRVSIGVGISDAASISMLEAMIMGSFPIQSNTSCADEWITCGESGLLVAPEDPQVIAAAIRRAVADDVLVNRASELNARTVKKRLDESVIRPKLIAMYEKIMAKSSRSRMGGRSN